MADPIPLDAQIIEVEKTVRDRVRRYPDLVARGRLKQETADAKLAALRAAQSSLIFLEKHADWIKAEHARRKADADRQADIDAVRDEPTVAADLDAMPDADVTVSDLDEAYA